MKNNFLASLLALCILGLSALPAAAAIHPQAGLRGSSILSGATSARARGMGRAFTAVADDSGALLSNPAGLGFLNDIEISGMNRQLFEGISHSYASLIYPLGDLTAANIRHFGALGADVGFIDYGEFTGRDPAGNRATDFSGGDRLIGVAYGKSVTSRFAFGVQAKHYKLELFDASTQGTAVDFGVLIKPARQWSVGAAVLNAGGRLQFQKQDEDLPGAIAAGVAYVPLPDRLTFAVDVEDPEDDYLRYRAGFEWWATQVFALRTGYDSMFQEGTGLSVGLGLRIQQFEIEFFPIKRIFFDYAYTPATDLGDLHNVTLTLKFGE